MSNYDDDATLGGWELDGTAWNAMAAEIETAYDYVNALTATTTQVNYLNTATSNIQTQLDAKATITGTQTLTNKTLGSATAIDLGSDAEGDLYYRNSSGDLARLAVGTNAQVLTVASGLPSWATSSSVTAKDQMDYIIYKSGGTSYGIDVSDGSVVASGTTDDVVIQAVIDDAEAASKLRIHIKAGSYNITNTLGINSHIFITGAGQEATELRAANGLNADIMQINSDLSAATHYRVNIHDLKFDGNNGNQSAGSCLVMYGTIQSHIIRCHFESMYDYGIEMRPLTGDTTGAYGHHNQVIDCLFDQGDGSSGAGVGIYMRNNDENVILASQFQYLKIGIHDEIGFNSIESNSFVNGSSSTSNKGVYLQDCSRTRIVNNVFDLLTGHGIHLKGAFNTVSSNTFYDNGDGAANTYDCIHIEWYGSNTIANNVFMNSASKARYGINENGNASEDTYGNNLLIGNMFHSVNGATTLAANTWGSGALNETNTNLKSMNYALTSSGATLL